MSIKKAYYYLFYKFYKFSEAAPSRWLSDWKAELCVDALEIFLGLSFLIYYTVFTKQWINIANGKAILLYVALISLPNYFIFHHKHQWKEIVKEFDKLPKKKNLIGSCIVFIIVLAIITNLIVAFYQMSLIDWSKYR